MKAVRRAYRKALNVELANRNLPEALEGLKPRPYIKLGGALSRVGLQYRRSILQQQYPRLAEQPPRSGMLFGGQNLFDTLQDSVSSNVEQPASGTTPIAELRDQVYVFVAEKLSGQSFRDGVIPEKIMPHVKDAVMNLYWPNQSKQVLGVLLSLLQRIAHRQRRQAHVPPAQDSGNADA